MKKIILILILIVLISGCAKEIEEKKTPTATQEEEAKGIPEIKDLPEHCKDGVYNEGEQGLDCGWTCPNECKFKEKAGRLEKDETWSGNILVTFAVDVPEDITLSIEPGTVVKFKPWLPIENGVHTCDESGRKSIIVYGTLRASGTPEKQIWFTSGRENPINGDWFGITFRDSKSPENIIKYAIVEFGTQNINFWNSYAHISHSIIRWCNWEGIYMEYHCNPLIEYNRIYENAYHGIAMEQLNNPTLRYNLIKQSVFSDFSSPIVEHNIIERFHASAAEGQPVLRYNTIRELFSEKEAPEFDLSINNENIVNELNFDYQDLRNYELGYIPGDQNKDRYPYVYPIEDDTRKIVSKHLAEVTDLLWNIDYDSNYLWAALDREVLKIDPNSFQILDRFTTPSPWIQGLASDGNHIWVNGYDDYTIYEIDPNTKNIVSSFSVEGIDGVAKAGLDVIGDYVYIHAGQTAKLYKFTKTGSLVKETDLKFGGGSGLTYDGQYFYTCCGDKICKFDEGGNLKGKIYSGGGCWDVAWKDGNIWSAERTNEKWWDEKLYQIKIKDDQLLLGYCGDGNCGYCEDSVNCPDDCS